MLVQGCRVCDGSSSDRQGWTLSDYPSTNIIYPYIPCHCFNGPGSVSPGGLLYLQCRTNSTFWRLQWLRGAHVSNQSTTRSPSDVLSKIWARSAAKKPSSAVWCLWERWRWGISWLAFGDSPTREGTNHTRKRPLIQQTGGLRGGFHFETSRRIVNPFAFRSRLLVARSFSLSSFRRLLLGLQYFLDGYLESADVDRHLQFLPLARWTHSSILAMRIGRGCERCRLRHIKCTIAEGASSCNECSRLSRACHLDPPFRFKTVRHVYQKSQGTASKFELEWDACQPWVKVPQSCKPILEPKMRCF